MIIFVTQSTGVLGLSDGGIAIEVRGNLMKVGASWYQLTNIARFSSIKGNTGFDGGFLKAAWSKKWQFLVIIVVASVVQSAGLFSPSTVRALLVIALVWTLAEVIWMLVNRKTLFILLIESAGSVSGVLGSRNPSVIEEIVALICDSIRNPPVGVIHKYFGDVTTNINQNQFNQNAPGAIGQQFNKRSNP